jgi:hypothetical protein
MNEFAEVWQRITDLQGQTFHQKTGRSFTYTVTYGSVVPSTANRQLARSQFARAYERGPLRGPGQLQDLQGPSYLYAILTDPRVASTGATAPDRSQNAVTKAPVYVTSTDRFEVVHARSQSNSTPAGGTLPPLRLGHRLSSGGLLSLDFRSLDLRIGRTDLQLPGGTGCEWTAVGDVPDAPGLYAFTLQRPSEDDLRVVYVGMTEHLWMVTKGHLPRGGGARGGQRYGRPTHAGVTRQRINIEVRRAHQDGWIVRQWVRPLPFLAGTREEGRTALRAEEEALISRWQLRRNGWNRG